MNKLAMCPSNNKLAYDLWSLWIWSHWAFANPVVTTTNLPTNLPHCCWILSFGHARRSPTSGVFFWLSLRTLVRHPKDVVRNQHCRFFAGAPRRWNDESHSSKRGTHIPKPWRRPSSSL